MHPCQDKVITICTKIQLSLWLKFLSKSVDIVKTMCYNIITVREVSKIAEQEKPKRKTHTSSEVTLRYKKKTFQQYSIMLRKVEDADCIEMIEKEKAKGYATSEAFKRLIRKNK